MAIFSIEIADGDVNRVLGAVASNYNRPEQVANPDFDASATIANPDFDPDQPIGPENQEEITDPAQVEFIDNPEAIPQFVNRVVREFLADHVKTYEIEEARRQAADPAAAAIDLDISDPQL